MYLVHRPITRLGFPPGFTNTINREPGHINLHPRSPQSRNLSLSPSLVLKRHYTLGVCFLNGSKRSPELVDHYHQSSQGTEVLFVGYAFLLPILCFLDSLSQTPPPVLHISTIQLLVLPSSNPISPTQSKSMLNKTSMAPHSST
ncbi:hypothetical protein LXL04_014926 [Taraxacum kok-saghyz]